MNILFFFVHPAKYHTFHYCIDRLKKEGHSVDVAIISKDVLEDLVKSSGWDYVNIFPEGRRGQNNSRFRIYTSAAVNFFRTVWRLFKLIHASGKKYDVFVTDDCLSVVGALMRVPVLFFLDNDVSMIPECSPLFICSSKIFAPTATDLGSFSRKKITFNGYKELCYLHPAYFKRDKTIPEKYGLSEKKYVFIRLVSFSATHDAGKDGVPDDKIERLIEIVQKHGLQPVISAERALQGTYEKYRFKGRPDELIQILASALLYFGDSQTMNSEAIVLGLPAICCNDFVNIIGVMREQQNKYGMTYGFLSSQFDGALHKLDELLCMPDLSEIYEKKYRKMISSQDDVSLKLYHAIEQMGGEGEK